MQIQMNHLLMKMMRMRLTMKTYFMRPPTNDLSDIGHHAHYSVVHISPPTSLIAWSPSPLNGPPTSPVLHTNPLQQGKSLVTFSVLPHTIWTWAVTLIPGCYDGLFVGQQAILDRVYKLASRGPQNFKLDI